MLRVALPRLARMNCGKAQELMCAGQAFVAPAKDLLGTGLQRWNWDFLEEHIPLDRKYGVMLDIGDGKIVMSHTARNGERLAGQAPQKADDQEADEDASLQASDQVRNTFREFRADADRYRRDGGRLPYFGLHVLWRNLETDNGFLGDIGEEMSKDIWTINFDMLREWQQANILPLVQRLYLFVGLGGTLYHCHYDLQPNLHFQLTGRKRFILFPPEDWPHLYPFPVHHDLDRRSMLDFDAPDDERFPDWALAHGSMVELEPGDALYIPPFWWHHVQSLTPETTSMAMWFFEHTTMTRSEPYGVGPRARDVSAMREAEETIGDNFPTVPGEEDCSKSRPVKARQVHNYAHWLKQRLGLPGSPPDAALLAELQRRPEEVETEVLRSLQARLGCDVEVARQQLRAFLSGRF